ncbi:MAG: hypothetical protein DRG35_00670 [Deltaproteobacteria bacterium]|nr:hypothetical protein [Deltaproteobacteria bacterium]OQY17166.1 MAG: hypothetical protein B6I32_01470 [Desulfobacterium sp. 4572_20]RLJ05208.1 MAG: hypothetical protein DRP14_02285 [Candidatus Aenigmarchaeota archaeon]HDH86433.1 hypothetical protein [Desulfobacteraceae bacterium]MBW2332143.1 hypothetical protein [Deltaproteobacteria bacterium]
MFPFCFEWAWDVGHIIFMGLLYMVLGAISLGLLYAFVMTWLKVTGRDKLFERLWIRFPITLW